MLSSETKAEILHAHYVDTFGQIRTALAQRDRLFTYTLVVLAVMILQIIAPHEANTMLGRLLQSELGFIGAVSQAVIGAGLWIAALGLGLRYFQSIIYIERQYEYIHELEKLLAANWDGVAFTREGKWYLDHYPYFAKWLGAVYTIVFPVLYLFVLGVRLRGEYIVSQDFSQILLLDTAIGAAISVSVVLYLVARHFQR